MYIWESVASARIEGYEASGSTFRPRKADAAQTCRYEKDAGGSQKPGLQPQPSQANGYAVRKDHRS